MAPGRVGWHWKHNDNTSHCSINLPSWFGVAVFINIFRKITREASHTAVTFEVLLARPAQYNWRATHDLWMLIALALWNIFSSTLNLCWISLNVEAHYIKHDRRVMKECMHSFGMFAWLLLIHIYCRGVRFDLSQIPKSSKWYCSNIQLRSFIGGSELNKVNLPCCIQILVQFLRF